MKQLPTKYAELTTQTLELLFNHQRNQISQLSSINSLIKRELKHRERTTSQNSAVSNH